MSISGVTLLVCLGPPCWLSRMASGEALLASTTVMVDKMDLRMGAGLFARNRVVELGREPWMNVWVREQSPEWKLGLGLANLGLAV